MIRPLEQFRQGLREADGPGFSTAVCQLLESIGAADGMSKPSAGLPSRRRSVCG